jgi:hypothetical protein
MPGVSGQWRHKELRFPLPRVGKNVYIDDYTRVVTIRI